MCKIISAHVLNFIASLKLIFNNIEYSEKVICILYAYYISYMHTTTKLFYNASTGKYFYRIFPHLFKEKKCTFF